MGRGYSDIGSSTGRPTVILSDIIFRTLWPGLSELGILPLQINSSVLDRGLCATLVNTAGIMPLAESAGVDKAAM